MTNADIDITTTISETGGTVYLTDNADYSTLNVITSAIDGLGTLTGPSGNVFISRLTTASPMIDLNGGQTVSASFTLPTTSDGEIVEGTYTVLYKVNAPYNLTGIAIDDILGVPDNTITITGDYSYLESGDAITIAGSAIPGNNGAKLISAATDSVVYSGGITTIRISTAMAAEAASPATLAFNLTKVYEKTYTYTYTATTQITPVPVISYDLQSGLYGSVTLTDESVYGSATIVSRILQLYRPNGLPSHPSGSTPDNPAVSSSSLTTSITTNKAATGEWTGIIVATISATGTDDLVVLYDFTSPSNTTTEDITDGSDICDLNPCLAEFEATLEGCNPSDEQKEKRNNLAYAMAGWLFAKQCTDNDKMNTYKLRMINLLGNTCECSSTFTGPEWINNYGEIIVDDRCELIWAAQGKIDTTSNFAAIGELVIPAKYFNQEDGRYAILEIEGQGLAGGVTVTIYNTTLATILYTWTIAATNRRLMLQFMQQNDDPALIAIDEEIIPVPDLNPNFVNTAGQWDLSQDLTINFSLNDAPNTIFWIATLKGYRPKNDPAS